MTVELAGKMISVLESLETSLHNIEMTLGFICVWVAFGLGVLVVKALWKER